MGSFSKSEEVSFLGKTFSPIDVSLCPTGGKGTDEQKKSKFTERQGNWGEKRRG